MFRTENAADDMRGGAQGEWRNRKDLWLEKEKGEKVSE